MEKQFKYSRKVSMYSNWIIYFILFISLTFLISLSCNYACMENHKKRGVFKISSVTLKFIM